MTRLWGELQVDTAILGGLVVVLLAIHIFMPADDMVSRLTGGGFPANPGPRDGPEYRSGVCPRIPGPQPDFDTALGDLAHQDGDGLPILVRDHSGYQGLRSSQELNHVTISYKGGGHADY